MRYTLDQLIDIQRSQCLLTSFSNAVGVAAALVDLEGGVRVGARWRQLCADCHCQSPQTCGRCAEGDLCLASVPRKDARFSLYRCPHGLVNAAAPILIDGEHVANVLVGQFLLDPSVRVPSCPSPAESGKESRLSFETLAQLTIIDEERIPAILHFLTVFCETVATMGAERLRMLEQQMATQSLVAIVESSDDAIYSKNRDFIITSWNKGAERLYGYTVKEAVGKHISFLILPQEEGEIQEVTDRLRHAERIVNMDAVCKTKDGRHVSVSLKVSPIRDIQGNIVGSSSIARDITARKLTEEALTRSEAQYRTLFEKASDVIFLIEDGRFIECNTNATLAFDCAKEQILGKPPSALSPQYQPDGELSTLKATEKMRLALEGIPQLFQWDHCRYDGTVFNSEVSLNRLEHQGRVQLLAIVRDITERMRAEAEARLNESRMESLLRIMQRDFQSSQEMLDYALDEMVSLTESKLGYIFFYDDVAKEFIIHAWSKNSMEACRIMEPASRYALEKTGIWGEAVRQAGPIIVNDFAAPNPLKHGYPEGHPELHNFMTAPVFSKGRIVAVGGVANKSTDYNDADVRQLTLLLESVWHIIERKIAEEKLRISEERLRLLSNNIPNSVFLQIIQETANVLHCQFASDGITNLFGVDAQAASKDFNLVLRLIHPRDMPKIVAKRERSLATFSPICCEFRLCASEGRIRWIRSQAAPRRLSNETVIWDCFMFDITEQKAAAMERERLIRQLQEALAEVKTLSGLLPICANCKKVRDDTGYWTQIEQYIHEHSRARFSHGICPDCIRELYPDFEIKTQGNTDTNPETGSVNPIRGG